MRTNLEKFFDLVDVIAQIACITMIIYSVIDDDYVKAIFYLLLTVAWEKKV